MINRAVLVAMLLAAAGSEAAGQTIRSGEYRGLFGTRVIGETAVTFRGVPPPPVYAPYSSYYSPYVSPWSNGLGMGGAAPIAATAAAAPRYVPVPQPAAAPTTVVRVAPGIGAATVAAPAPVAPVRRFALGPQVADALTGPVRVTVGYPPGNRDVPVVTELAATVAERLERIDRIQKVTPILAVMEGGVLVLRGYVAGDRDRALAEIIAGMEPGVGAVRNELIVGAPTSAAR